MEQHVGVMPYGSFTGGWGGCGKCAYYHIGASQKAGEQLKSQPTWVVTKVLGSEFADHEQT